MKKRDVGVDHSVLFNDVKDRWYSMCGVLCVCV